MKYQFLNAFTMCTQLMLVVYNACSSISGRMKSVIEQLVRAVRLTDYLDEWSMARLILNLKFNIYIA